ncbi:MOSC domain-containing protein [Lignipirellula cremea]|uniref:6-N-hydroxylaminopurine resistance protein n=1 Tax=Lignipirellula cremea TaxID=2528010 RepID=A0A518E2B5_9BACT|nr:MOSC domain-containing protein [Lignipirellula cremea]QDU98231.1 6-N-hydroxylaminopurine resistance protein [Lignipirellula cremea]
MSIEEDAQPAAAMLVSLQVGLPQELTWKPSGSDRSTPWTTGFHKTPTDQPLWLARENLAGDGQADLVHHGGPHKAVCVYPADHYPYWETTLDRDLPHGAFGENFTLAGLTETQICIGDTWAIGSALLQVSQPRQPCFKLARRWNVKDLAHQVQQNGRTGWYFRVLVEGEVAAGMRLALQERPHPEWTVALANQIMHHDPKNAQAAAGLAAVPLLSPNWQESLLKRVRQQTPVDERLRLDGGLPTH